MDIQPQRLNKRQIFSQNVLQMFHALPYSYLQVRRNPAKIAKIIFETFSHF